jgi:hypothetical protein
LKVLCRICNTYTVLVCLAGQDVKYFSAEFNNETFFTEPSSAAPPTEGSGGFGGTVYFNPSYVEEGILMDLVKKQV